jgi:hypothetical protein
MTSVMAVLFTLSMALPGMAGSVPQLIAALFVLGACNGGLDVAMNSQAALVEQRYGRPIMASFHGLWSIGGLTGAALGGLVAAQGVALGPHLLAIALVALLAAAVALRWLVPTQGGAQGDAPGFVLPPRTLAIPGLLAFGVLFCEGAIGDWSGVYMRESLGSGPGRRPSASRSSRS